MMIDLCNRLVDNDLSQEELLPRIDVVKTTLDDAKSLIMLLAKCFNLSSEFEAYMQLKQSQVLLTESVKAVDRETGDIYGFLLLCDYPIIDGSPIRIISPRVSWMLSLPSQINGHSFFIDERLRGTGIDKKMLDLLWNYISQYDMIWCAVEKGLKSHNYWQRIGFEKLFSISEATFYAMPCNEKAAEDIYYIAEAFKDEEHHIDGEQDTYIA